MNLPPKIHWAPTPRQTEALLAEVDELLYGGARGGGKTDAGQVWMIEPHYITNPKYRGLVIRKNSEDLKDWIDRARQMYLPLKAEFSGNPAEIRFPSGAVIRTGHLKDAGAYTKYQGHEYHKILIEELTKIPRENDYEKLLGSCRSTVPGLKARMMATTNPDGDGYEWVKRRWDCEKADKQVRLFVDKETGFTRSRLFVPAKVEDNPHLTSADPGYISLLNSITDPVLRRQWREGSWEEPSIEGAYYARYIKEAENDNRITKVPYDTSVPVDTWWDLGIGDAMAIWFTQDVGHEIHVIDYLEAEGEGIPYYLRELQLKKYVYRTHHWPHDGAARELTTGVSRQETAERLGLKPIEIVPMLSVDDGIQAVRNLLSRCWFDEEKTKEGLRMLKNYKKEYDEKRNIYRRIPEHDFASHGADAFRTLGVGHKEYKSAPNNNLLHKRIQRSRHSAVVR